jgi:hypothetical protein
MTKPKRQSYKVLGNFFSTCMVANARVDWIVVLREH